MFIVSFTCLHVLKVLPSKWDWNRINQIGHYTRSTERVLEFKVLRLSWSIFSEKQQKQQPKEKQQKENTKKKKNNKTSF